MILPEPELPKAARVNLGVSDMAIPPDPRLVSSAPKVREMQDVRWRIDPDNDYRHDHGELIASSMHEALETLERKSKQPDLSRVGLAGKQKSLGFEDSRLLSIT